MIVSYTPKAKHVRHDKPKGGGYYTHKCDHCGTEFHSTVRRAKYCSTDCYKRMYNSARYVKPTPKSKSVSTVTNSKKRETHLIVTEAKTYDFLKKAGHAFTHQELRELKPGYYIETEKGVKVHKLNTRNYEVKI